MASTLAPTPLPTDRRPAAGRRFGYVLAVAINGVFLWISHQLLDWEWPGFLTEEFDRLLPLVTASFVASMVVNTVYLVRDRGRVRSLGELTTAAFGLVVSIRTWTVFPFDFAGYGTDWTWLVRTLLVIGIVGTSIAGIVHLTRLVTGGPAASR